MTTAEVKRKNRNKRQVMGYEPNPPRCENCKDLVPAMLAIPGKAVYRAPHCNVLGFPVKLHGICDSWTSKTGETLAP